MSEQTLKCIETKCGNCTFTFTEGEQKFYAEKGFTPPKRCPACREAKKALKTGTTGAPPPAKKVEFINEPPVKTDRRGAYNKDAKKGGRKHYDDDN